MRLGSDASWFHESILGGSQREDSLSAVTASDARGFFEHCGYRQAFQL
jgi:hypothetical protein